MRAVVRSSLWGLAGSHVSLLLLSHPVMGRLLPSCRVCSSSSPWAGGWAGIRLALTWWRRSQEASCLRRTQPFWDPGDLFLQVGIF